jgi:hypothetical protein
MSRTGERRARGATFDSSIVSGYSSYDESYAKESPTANVPRMRAYSEDYQAYSDTERAEMTLDEFGDGHFKVSSGKATGRLRKKNASRVKGGVFQEKKMKRRVYARCIGREIDTDRCDHYFQFFLIFLHRRYLQLARASIKLTYRKFAVESKVVRRYVY